MPLQVWALALPVASTPARRIAEIEIDFIIDKFSFE
jgi:hypothetical protein